MPPRATSRAPRTGLRIMIGLVDVGCFSRCHAVGAASDDLSVSQDCSSDHDRFCRCLGVSQDATSLVPPQATSRSPRIDLRILIGFVVFGCFSRCRVVGIAPGDLSVRLVSS